MFNCCKYRVDITKKHCKAASKLVIKSFKNISLWISQELAKQVLCVESQSVCIVWFICYTIKSHVQSKFKSISGLQQKYPCYYCMWSHCIFFSAHYEFSYLCIFVTYTISSMAKICAFYETYIIIVARVDTFDCSLFFWRELLTGCPEALDFETFREEPLWRTYQKFSRAFFSLCF